MTLAPVAFRSLKILGISIALLNLILWFCVPAIRVVVDAATGRLAPLKPQEYPTILNGVQELFVYFDPWLARGFFPIVYTLGFAAIPFLKQPREEQIGSPSSQVYAFVVLLLLTGLEFVWLFLIAVGVFLRGPNWVIFLPGEVWTPYKIPAFNNVDLSQYFWGGFMQRSTRGLPWAVRELPGLLLLGGYFVAGGILVHWLWRREQRATPYWRWAVLVLLIQFATLVPIKMALRWAFDLKYLIAIPEYSWNV